MSFNSQEFWLVFLPFFILPYWMLAERPRLRLMWLVAGSYTFYALWDVRFIALLGITTLIDYGLGWRMSKRPVPQRRPWMILGVVIRLGTLGYFKYAEWGVDAANGLFGTSFGLPDIVLPVGISFYTFQALSYLIDVGRGRVTASRDLLPYAAYLAMFPQLSSGPIARYTQMQPQLDAAHTPVAYSRVQLAIWFIVIGLAKKVLIADMIADRIAVLEQLHPEGQFWTTWGVMLGYMFQLYFDFSGYSDIAVGLGHLLGFDLPQNFNKPYRATSITDFWNRWHMSLSFWMRDYLFFPLSRALLKRWRGVSPGVIRTLSQLITMGLIGLWHGASLTMVVWGLYHGALLALAAWRRDRRLVLPVPLLNWAATMGAVLVGWVLFRAESFGAARTNLEAMLGLNGFERALPLNIWGSRFIVLLALGGLLVLIGYDTWDVKPRSTVWVAAALAAVAALCILVMGQPETFLYFRF